MSEKGYVDKTGRVLFVADGISCGRYWATYYRKPNGSLKRYVSSALPLRETKEQAQRDLDQYAEAEGLKLL